MWRSEDNLESLSAFHVGPGIELGSQAWWQAPVPTEPFCQPYIYFLNKILLG